MYPQWLRVHYPYGKHIGNFGQNPLLNSILYGVEFPDGAIKSNAENVINQNMHSQIYADGY